MTAFAPWQRRPLATALDSLIAGRLGHGLLLCGPEKLGKRAVADAIVRRLLCRSPSADSLACGSCRGCTLLAAGTHPDFKLLTLEINENTDKPRSEIVIEQVRRLGEWFALTSQLGGAQVVLLDPADALNPSAANALLKTLEEPSPGRYLLLVASRPARLPATIRSRCQRLEFRLPARDEAMAWLQAQGRKRESAEAALDAASGHPGLAAAWLVDDALALRLQVQRDLDAVAANRLGPVEVAGRWLADEQAELRLRFAADLALDRAAELAGARRSSRAGLTAADDFPKLSAWFDAANRTRELLRTPIRADLALAGLLLDWRSACARP